MCEVFGNLAINNLVQDLPFQSPGRLNILLFFGRGVLDFAFGGSGLFLHV